MVLIMVSGCFGRRDLWMSLGQPLLLEGSIPHGWDPTCHCLAECHAGLVPSVLPSPRRECCGLRNEDVVGTGVGS